MFERFTNQSRRAVVLAQEEARLLSHNHIGTEHLLLGLLHEGKGSAARALTAMDVTLTAVRDQVVAIIGRGQAQSPGHIPFTSQAKKALELSLREAQQRGAGAIGTGHLLLGLLHQGDDVAVEMLDKLGVDRKDLRDRVLQELRDHPEEGRDVRLATGKRQQLTVLMRNDVRGLLDMIDDRLGTIERHLGIGQPTAGAGTAAEQGEAAAGAAGRQAEPAAGAETTAGAQTTAGGESGEPGESGELARLRARVSRLEGRLREHGIDPDEPQEPPAASG